MKQWDEYKKEIAEGILPAVEQIIESEKLVIPNRTRHIAHQRFFIMWFLRRNTEMTLSQIGNLFKKDHATVIHGINYHDESIEINDEVYSKNVESVKGYLEKVLEDIPHST